MLREEIEYRAATAADASELARFGSESFVAAYGHALRRGDLALHVACTYSEERQHQELVDPLAWTVLGEREGEIVGAALLRWAPPPAGLAAELRWAELARFYVARPYWRTGVSTDLMVATLKSVRDREGPLVWLQVWEGAPYAIAFYRKWGFYEVGEAPYRVGTLMQRDLVLARSLRHGSRPSDS